MLMHITDAMQSPIRRAITEAYRMDETACVEQLAEYADLPTDIKERIHKQAHKLVAEVRKQRMGKSSLDSFLYTYDLSTAEGVTLMCLAEALLRIPDKDNVDRLIHDKITQGDWKAHLGESSSVFVNAATMGLMLTGKIMTRSEIKASSLSHIFKKLVERSGEPVIRKAVMHAMRILGKQFVVGRTIEEALGRAPELEKIGYRYSYDMLGEAARTEADAKHYLMAYQHAITALAAVTTSTKIVENPGISVKLSALFARYEFAQRERALNAIIPRLLTLSQAAKKANIGLTVDAEEADRLDISLDIMESVFTDPSLEDWQGFGLAVQSYQKRAWYLLDGLAELARSKKRRLTVRLIKGAYWDSEIKQAQELGLEGYPVFTRKSATDISFLACAKKMLANTDVFYPQFGTHNAHSVASVIEMAGEYDDFEFQCLHGMGRALYDQIVTAEQHRHPCRIYAPVGSHEELLPYLVRRLLENGANSSFVNRIVNEKQPIDDIITDPIATVRHYQQIPHPKIPLPKDIYGSKRKNSHGIDLTNIQVLKKLADDLQQATEQTWLAYPTVADSPRKPYEQGSAVYDPSDRRRLVGWVTDATDEQVDLAIAKAHLAAPNWDKVPVEQRAALLLKAADLYECHYAELIALAVREGGKNIPAAVSEVREAVDFCRYYANLGMVELAPQELPGPTGESNRLSMHGRGPVCCISPWNFPLAIFTGQAVAALVTGNTVLAKPAEQTPLIAAYAVRLLHQAGIPKDVLQLLPGRGETVGARLVADTRIRGVVFTGSTETARAINQTLANRDGPIVPLIAETGGQNAMIVDSSALPEQVIQDIIRSAFDSAGQRCSALRVLYLQDVVADKMMTMLRGAMAELNVGDPALLATDVGPVIDNDAKAILEAHARRMDEGAELIYQVSLREELAQGTFFAPRAYELCSLKQLSREVFGPILHIIRFNTHELDKVIADINHTGYGLTLGIHSRIDETIDYIKARVRAGNCYVNRNMVGAVVGVQPFGGEGLSGTGPKAGGPHYLFRLSTERSISVNTTAAGGNATLMALGE